MLPFRHPFALAFFALTGGKKESPEGKSLILGVMSEPRSCQPEGKVFCQIMEKGPDTAGAYVAFFWINSWYLCLWSRWGLCFPVLLDIGVLHVLPCVKWPSLLWHELPEGLQGVLSPILGTAPDTTGQSKTLPLALEIRRKYGSLVIKEARYVHLDLDPGYGAE